MFELVTAAGTLPFVVALVVVMMLALVEVIGALTGFSASGMVEDAIDLSPSAVAGAADYASTLDRFLGWLHCGKVPALVLLAIFLLVFGGFGLAVQIVLHGLAGFTLPAWLLAPAAIPPAFVGTRWLGGLMARVMPRDETQSISRDDLVGRVAIVVLGEARVGSPAQAKVRDRFGRQHYVMIEPDDAAASFAQGSRALLVARNGGIYRAIVPDNSVLAP